jgi:hypothetical protein
MLRASTKFTQPRICHPPLSRLCVDDNGKLADPGQNWNATDAVTDPTLPWKRPIWAAVGSDYYIVHYERRGIDHSFHILVANSRSMTGNQSWSGTPLDTNSKTTRHFSTPCEQGSWTTEWIMGFEAELAIETQV